IAAAIALIAPSFLGRPAAAPFRSIRCRRRAPCASQCLAVAVGSSENTVASFIAPCFRRTHFPSFKSMAGMISMAERLQIQGQDETSPDQRRSVQREVRAKCRRSAVYGFNILQHV